MKRLISITTVVICLLACSKKEEQQVLPEVDIATGSLIDIRDGQQYKTIRVGKQEWMAENLNYRLPKGTLDGCYTYGESTIRITDVVIDKAAFVAQVNQAVKEGKIVDPPGLPVAQQPTNIIRLRINLYTPRQLMDQLVPYPEVVAVINTIYEGLLEEATIAHAKRSYTRTEAENGGYAERFGLLYTQQAAVRAVPEGWRLPTDEDWMELESTLGMPSTDLKDLDQWRGVIAPRLLTGTRESIGFDAKFGGGRLYGTFMYGTPYMNVDVNAYYWTATSVTVNDSTMYAITRNLMLNQPGIMRGTAKSEAAYQVRCIKN